MVLMKEMIDEYPKLHVWLPARATTKYSMFMSGLLLSALSLWQRLHLSITHTNSILTGLNSVRPHTIS